jgi:multiple sugar transport system substrate-binding protein
MKRFTRIAGAVAIAAGFALVASGCASSGSGGGGDNTQITWWSPNWDDANAKVLIDKFEKANPGTTVKMVETTNDTMANKIKTVLDSGTTPDVITELVSRVPLYSAKDQLLDLSSWYDSSMPKDDFNEQAVGAVSSGDKTYAVPWRWDASGFVYNKDMFDQAGITAPPKTLDELTADAKLIKDKLGIAATGWPFGSDSNTQTRFLDAYYSNGGAFTPGSDGSVKMDSDASVKALETLAAGFKDGSVSQASFESDNTAMQQLLINKQIAFYSDGAYALDPIKKAGINVGSAEWPGVDGPGTVSTNGWAYMVPKASANQKLAEKFVQFMNTADNQAFLTLTFPARLSAASNDKFSDPLLKPFLDQQNQSGKAAPSYPGWSQMTQTIFSAVQKVALDQASASDANQAIMSQAANVLKVVK